MSRDRVLVTGGAGFIGVNLGPLLRDHGLALRCFDDLSTGSRAAAEAAGYDQVVVGDVADATATAAAAEGCRYVVHLAAQAGVPTSVADPVRDCDVNVRGTLNALMAARDSGADTFVLASSHAPLGEARPPLHEGMVPRPKSPYGASKLAGEAYCSAFTGSYGLPTVSLRFGNVYGPHSAHKRSVVAAFCTRALAGEPLVVYGDGTQTRDFVHVDDICAGILSALTGGSVRGEVVHLASGVETPVLQVAEHVAQRFGGVAVEHRPARTGDVARSAADITRARELLGFEPRTPLHEGLDRTVSWFRERR